MDKSAISHMGLHAEDFPVSKTVSRRNRKAPSGALVRPEALKRAMDLAIASLALFFLLPLLLTVAIAIKLDSRGPVLFWQTRRGLYGRPFKILKFRTMTVLEDGSVVEQAKREDSRVTRLGRCLRRTSIDELPQLINVIRGEMSLVGPRPHALAHDDYYGRLIEDYSGRHDVKPGITGWAQINGARGETPELADMRRRVELDLWYVQRWSVGLDLKIIVVTAIQVIRSPDAF
jgi:exopolysaccharide biosynthesis polyprenyl glycosylphosphotransferase